ncbi:NADH-dependent [FeFe] hydrogenase, group A6 [Aminipila sp.]|uniref:NADH-dependent [FeFe] hydrogenase, group A6 n=1 Tax=Aminipila sp. TaxID=2060095 RepID=UPI0028969CD8|nr:NADH-dependent [FeFe] hydrogenase, group A6 [Aminipila sp.]
MENIAVKINGMEISAPAGSTILEAAQLAHIEIPTLCYLKDINEIGACRMCVVEVKGARTLVAACVHPITPNMEIITNSKRVLDSRKKTLQLLMSNHTIDCFSCGSSGNCELIKLCHKLHVDDSAKYAGSMPERMFDDTAIHMVRDSHKCILCRRCVAMCEKVQGIGILGANGRGFDTIIDTAFFLDLGVTSCVNCGQCLMACPTGAISEKDQTDEVFEAINDPDKYVIVQTAPSVRAALGEVYKLHIGSEVEGKMVTALRMLGFDKVFDTDFAADLTIMEEANEFLNRVKNGGTLPLITSCSPGWVKFCEHFYPDMIEHLSSCKSPQQMFGAITKTYFAEKMGIDPAKIVSVSVMPCTAKKFERTRENQDASGYPDVDIAITTRELARMIDQVGLDFTNLPNGEFDNPLGESTGAGVIFGATGGVMEAALRTAVETLTGDELKKLDFSEVRGTEGIKEATYNVAGMDIHVAVASGLANARKVMDQIKSGEANYHFVEMMACPGGCVNGGGQPRHSARTKNKFDIKAMRASALYGIDASKPIRKSHENPAIKKLYAEYLGEPGSHKAHEILHTTYVKRKINK